MCQLRCHTQEQSIKNDTWCPDAVTQVASAGRALQEVVVGLFNDHLRYGLTAAAAGLQDLGDARLAGVTATIRQVIRL
jgi:CsoR family transcriptional regulator, copper-sensing transcriptional repressor